MAPDHALTEGPKNRYHEQDMWAIVWPCCLMDIATVMTRYILHILPFCERMMCSR